MSGWSELASFARTALGSAQKKIDEVLDIRDDDAGGISGSSSAEPIRQQLQDDFFAAFGLTHKDVVPEDPVGYTTEGDSLDPGAIAAPVTNQLKQWLPAGIIDSKGSGPDASRPGTDNEGAETSGSSKRGKKILNWNEWFGGQDTPAASSTEDTRSNLGASEAVSDTVRLRPPIATSHSTPETSVEGHGDWIQEDLSVPCEATSVSVDETRLSSIDLSPLPISDQININELENLVTPVAGVIASERVKLSLVDWQQRDHPQPHDPLIPTVLFPSTIEESSSAEDRLASTFPQFPLLDCTTYSDNSLALEDVLGSPSMSPDVAMTPQSNQLDDSLNDSITSERITDSSESQSVHTVVDTGDPQFIYGSDVDISASLQAGRTAGIEEGATSSVVSSVEVYPVDVVSFDFQASKSSEGRECDYGSSLLTTHSLSMVTCDDADDDDDTLRRDLRSLLDHLVITVSHELGDTVCDSEELKNESGIAIPRVPPSLYAVVPDSYAPDGESYRYTSSIVPIDPRSSDPSPHPPSPQDVAQQHHSDESSVVEAITPLQESGVMQESACSFVELELDCKEGKDEGDESFAGEGPFLLPRKASAGSSEETGSVDHFLKGSGYTSPSFEEIESSVLSSDIEILSNPTPNGDNGSERSFRSGPTPQNATSPIKHMYGVSTSHFHNKHKHKASDLLMFDNAQLEAWRQKVAHLTEILHARERSLVELSTQNAKLSEDYEGLEARYSRLVKHTDDPSSETAFQLVSQELSTLREKSKEIPKLMENITNLERSTRQKDEQIEQLMEEGQKLARNELKHTTIIKKLREKEKESEKLVESQRLRLKEMDELRSKLKTEKENAVKLEEELYGSVATVEQQEKLVAQLQSDVEDSNEKCTSMKSNLEKCYKEMTDLRKAKAVSDAEIEHLEAKLASKQSEELKEANEREERQKNQERQTLLQQVEDLRLSLIHSSEEHNRREDALRWEIAQSQKKLQEAELRNEELSESASVASKPLLRQMDNLRSSFQSQQKNWERIEKSLYERIAEAEKKAATSSEKEASYGNAMLDLRSKVSQLEAQQESLSSVNKRLQQDLAKLSDEKKKLAESVKRLEKEVKNERDMKLKALEDNAKDKELLSSQFEYEKAQMRTHYEHRIHELDIALQDKGSALARLSGNDNADNGQVGPAQADKSGSRSPEITIVPSRSSSVFSFGQDSSDDWWPASGTEFVSSAGLTSLLERLRERLQMKEGEIGALKEEIKRLQHSKEALTRELAQVETFKDGLESQLTDYEDTRQKLEQLEISHQTLLQMYGAREEEIEELKMDLNDIKEVYKSQISELLCRDTSE